MSTNNFYADAPRISERLAEMRVPWTPIDEIAGMLERRYGRKFNGTTVRLQVQSSRQFRIAWAPGGHTLVASNCARPSNFVE